MNELGKGVWIVAILLMVASIYLLQFAIRKKEFFRRREWRSWSGYASSFGGVLEVVDKIFGAFAARICLGILSLLILAFSLWAMRVAID